MRRGVSKEIRHQLLDSSVDDGVAEAVIGRLEEETSDQKFDKV